MATKITPASVLEAKTPRAAAARLAAYLRETFETDSVLVWSPQETKARGWGSGWAVCWEEGPYEWTAITMGSSFSAGATGNYSKPGPFPEGLSSPTFHCEPYNGFILNFYEIG
jgi:hypothetical protein